MSEIKRYSIGEYTGIGEYVLFTDHDRVIRERDEAIRVLAENYAAEMRNRPEKTLRHVVAWSIRSNPTALSFVTDALQRFEAQDAAREQTQ